MDWELNKYNLLSQVSAPESQKLLMSAWGEKKEVAW